MFLNMNDKLPNKSISESFVSTLPISPRSNPNLGFYCSPFIADCLSRLTECSLILPINIRGMKNERTDGQDQSFKNDCGKLGINPDLWWDDNDDDIAEIIQDIIEQLIDIRLVTIETESVSICNCGAVETLSIAFFEKQKVKVLDEQENCSLCGSSLETIEMQCLKLRLLKKEPFRTIPSNHKGEVLNTQDKITSHPILISRSRKKGVKVSINGNDFILDTDFVWSLFPTILFRRNISIKTLVCSHKAIWNAVYVYLLNKALIGDYIFDEVVLNPYCHTKISHEQSLNYCIEARRAFLHSILRFGQKDIVSDDRLLYLGNLSFENNKFPYPSLGSFTTEYAIRLLDGSEVTKHLKRLRAGKIDEVAGTFFKISHRGS